MNEIRVSFDRKRYKNKPLGTEVGGICKRVARNIRCLKKLSDIKEFLYDVGERGCAFSPATYTNGLKREENFEQMQMFVLDFDGNIAYETVRERAEEYEFYILAAYDTFSSNNHDRFRIIFLNNIPIIDKLAAKIYKNALLTVFPEADRSDSDISKMYYGGKELLYYDEKLPTLDVESTIRKMTYYLKEKYGVTHYKNYVKEFAKKNKIRLNKNGLLDVSVGEDTEELEKIANANGKNSPKSFLFCTPDGELLPKESYYPNPSGGGTKPSVGKERNKNHLEYRSSAISSIIARCRLYSEFRSGRRCLHHNELLGISTSIIHVESGISTFKKILSEYPEFYDAAKQRR